MTTPQTVLLTGAATGVGTLASVSLAAAGHIVYASTRVRSTPAGVPTVVRRDRVRCRARDRPPARASQARSDRRPAGLDLGPARGRRDDGRYVRYQLYILTGQTALDDLQNYRYPAIGPATLARLSAEKAT